MKHWILLLIFYPGFFKTSRAKEFNLTLCNTREGHWRNNQHNYLFSGFLQEKKNQKMNWENARKFCRERCMDLISIESEWEHRLTARKMKKTHALSVWTSGHICDENVCSSSIEPILKPTIVFGWFWAGSGRKISATNSTPDDWTFSPWGHTGAVTQSLRQNNNTDESVPQPDNAEQRLGLERGEEEACLLIGLDRWEPGVWWDDAACYTEEEFICEDSTELLTKAGINKPVVFG